MKFAGLFNEFVTGFTHGLIILACLKYLWE